jgi:hypothetical protein
VSLIELSRSFGWCALNFLFALKWYMEGINIRNLTSALSPSIEPQEHVDLPGGSALDTEMA